MNNAKFPEAASAAVAVTTSLDASVLLGEWSNTNQSATGIARLMLTQAENGFVVRVLGAGNPQPFDWGEAPADLFADLPELSQATSFTSFHDQEFMSVWLLAYVNKGVLVVVSLTRFQDDSGRSNYWDKELFFRSRGPDAVQ